MCWIALAELHFNEHNVIPIARDQIDLTKATAEIPLYDPVALFFKEVRCRLFAKSSELICLHTWSSKNSGDGSGKVRIPARQHNELLFRIPYVFQTRTAGTGAPSHPSACLS